MISTAWRRTYRRRRRAVSKAELQPGDVLCFGWGPYSVNHVGIYIGGGQMVHASTYSTGVITSDINSNYYTARYVGAKRIVA
jgi:cell wall-associated NlpC family hydrolase